MTAYSDIKAAPSVLRIETLRPQDLTAEDARLWRSFLARRPELSGPYFDIRYVQAAASAVPDAGVARFYDEDRVVGYFPYQIRSGALQPFGQCIAAVKNQTRYLEREQADRRQQHDRDQPEIARPVDHAARPRIRARARSAKACAAAATDWASGKAV